VVNVSLTREVSVAETRDLAHVLRQLLTDRHLVAGGRRAIVEITDRGLRYAKRDQAWGLVPWFGV